MSPHSRIVALCLLFACAFSIAASAQAPNRTGFLDLRCNIASGIGEGPRREAFDPVHKNLFFPCAQNDTVIVVSTTTRTVVATIPVAHPENLDISADSSKVVVGSLTESFAVIDTATLKVSKVISLPSPWRDAGFPGSVFLLSTGNYLVISNCKSCTAGAIILEYDPVQGTFTPTVGDVNAINFYQGGVATRDHTKVLLGTATSGGDLALYSATAHGIVATKEYFGTTYGLAFFAANNDGTQFAADVPSPYNYLAILDSNLNEIAQAQSVGFNALIYSNDGTKILGWRENSPYTGGYVAVYNASTHALLGSSADFASGTRISAEDGTGLVYGLNGDGLGYVDITSLKNLSPVNGPAVGSVSPPGTRPSTSVATTISGYNLTAVSQVFFGSVAASSPATAGDGSVIYATAPAQTARVVNVFTYFANGWLGGIPGGFSYGPKIVEVLNSASSTTGGDQLTVMGYGFGTNPTGVSVTVGGRVCTNPYLYGTSSTSPNVGRITCTTPSGVAGLADVVVTTPYGTDTWHARFRYVPATTWSITGELYSVVYDRSRQKLFATSAGEIEVIDLNTNQRLAALLPPAGAPANMRLARILLTDDNSRLVVTDVGSSSVHVIDPDHPSNWTILSTGAQSPGSVAAVRGGKALIASASQTCSNPSCLLELDTSALTLGPPSEPQLQVSGSYPAYLASGDNGRLVFFVGCCVSNGPTSTWDAVTGRFQARGQATFSLDGASVAADASALGSDYMSMSPDMTIRAYQEPASEFQNGYGYQPLSGQLLHDSGALQYVPFGFQVSGPTYDGGVEIFDSTGALRYRVTFPERIIAPNAYLGVDSLTHQALAIDETGARLFAITQSGISMVTLPKAPIGIGWVNLPYGLPAGGDAVTVRGSGFQPGAAVSFDGVNAATTFLDVDTLSVVTPAHAAGKVQVAVTNTSGESALLAAGFEYMNARPLPSITSLDPAQAPTLGPAFQLTVHGSGFVLGSVVRWNGQDRPTAFVDNTQLVASIPSTELLSAATVDISVFTPPLGGGLSATQPFNVLNPIPVISNVQPSLLVFGGSARTVFVSATGVLSDTVAQWDGSDRPSAASASGVTVSITADDLAVKGTHAITLRNSAPGGGTSAGFQVTVDDAKPIVTYPTQLEAGSEPMGNTSYPANFSITNTGTGPLLISSVQATGDFQVGPWCTSLNPSPYLGCAFNVYFTPTQLGDRTGTLTITDNMAGSPHVIQLHGTGIAPASVTVTSPNGGESWMVNTTQNITWSFTGNPGLLRIDLLNPSNLYVVTTIANGINPGNGSFAWTIPQWLGTSPYIIRITSTQYGGILDSSDAAFSTYVPTWVQVTSPNGGELLTAGQPFVIYWQYADGAGTDFKVELLRDSGGPTVISNHWVVNSGGLGGLNWLVPVDQPAANDYRIRVTSNAVPTSWDTSDQPFSIGGLKVGSPNGGEVFAAGGSMPIQWSYGSSAGSTVKVELLRSGVVVQTIATSTSIGTAGNGGMTWTIPSTMALSSQYRVRVTSTSNPANTDTSDADFRINHTGIAVTAPNGGESWQVGTTQTIKWIYSGAVGTAVKVDLYKAGVLNKNLVASTSIGSSGSGQYSWAIAANQTLGSDYTVKVTSTTSSTISDNSNGTFSLMSTGVALMSPNGGEVWAPGSTHNITWTYSGNPGTDVKLELLKGGVVNATLVAAVPIANGSYSWQVPANQAMGSDYSVRITSNQNTQYTDTSNANFTVDLRYTLTVNPTGTGTYSITSSPSGISCPGTCSGAFSVGTPVTLTASPTNGTTFNGWSGACTGAGMCQVTMNSDRSVGADFTGPPMSLSVTAPNGGNTLTAGASTSITWTYTGAPGNVKLELLKSGSVVQTISSSAAVGSNGSGSLSWLVPSTTALDNDYRVRITSVSTPSVMDTSDADFRINRTGIAVTAPNGGESWQAGTTQTIRWIYSGSVGTAVKIDLYKAGALNKTLIAATSVGSGGTGQYNWTIPAAQTVGSDYTVKVTSTTLTTMTDTSNAAFAIVNTGVAVTSPNGGEVWAPGSTHNITWSYSGNPGTDVKIELLKGGVVNATLAAAAPIGTSGSGSFSWLVPANQTIGSDYAVRITSNQSTQYTDTSNANFTVDLRYTLTVNATGTGAYSVTSSPSGITCPSTCAAAISVGTPVTLTASPSAGTTFNGWSGACSGTSTCQVTMNADQSVGAAFTGPTVGITVSSPNGGEAWTRGTVHPITWTYSGTTGTAVKIELLKSGVLSRTISLSAPIGSNGAGTFNWIVPLLQAVGSDYTIRVTSTTQPTATDTSNASFAIQ